MGKRIFKEDVTSIALIYHRYATGSMMLSFETINAFDQVIDDNLEEMHSNIDIVHPVNYSKLIYFNTPDEKGNWYSIIKPNLDFQEIEWNYLRIIHPDLEKAATSANALSVLGLEIVDGKIVKKKSEEKSLKITPPKL